jgi:hypothetical protein
VPEAPKMRSDPSVGALVNQESLGGRHADGGSVLTSLGRGGRNCTARRA